MADIKTAEQISKKVRALKYFHGIIDVANKKGEAVIKLNCTGAEFVMKKDDVLYLKVKAMIAKLAEEIASLHIIEEETVRVRRKAPAPFAAANVRPARKIRVKKLTAEQKKEKQKAYMKKYNSRPEVKAARAEYARKYYARKKAEAAATPVV